MPLFIAFDHSLEFKGLSIHLNAGCPRLQLDRLIFPQMTHTLYFSESKDFRSQCVWKPDIDYGVSDPTLIVRSTLGQVDRLPLGAFLTLLPGEDSLALSAMFSPGKGNRKAKLHSVAVSMLGTVFNVEINIDQGMLSFTADADLYGNYPAQLSVSSQTIVPWERMEFAVYGQLNRSTVKEIDEYTKDYVLEEIINRALEREQTAKDAVIRANQTLSQLTIRLRMQNMRISEAQANFDRAFEESRVANETLRNATAGVDTANTQIGAAQNAEMNSETAEVFERLNEARRAVLAANTRLARARIQLDNVQQMRDIIRGSYYTARFAVIVSLINQQTVTAEIKDELEIARKYKNEGIAGVVALNDVTFKTEISTGSPTILPLTFSYSSFGQDIIKTITFDFTATKELNMRQISENIASEILDTSSRTVRRSTSRFTRQDTDSEIATRSRNEEEFQENCALIANIRQYVQNILNSVQMIQENTSLAFDSLQQSIENLQMQAESDTSEMDTMINFDALETLFNITRDEFSDDSDEEIIDNYKNYFRDIANNTEDILDGIDDTSFGEWQASMEMLHNESGSAAGYPCTGFADCLDSISGLLKRLITDLRPGADKETLQQQLDQNRQRFIQLATSMTLRVPQAVIVVTDMLETVNSETLSSYWCSLPPNITDQPPMHVNVSSGSDLNLECPYESSLPASAHWRKDGVPIPASNSSTLVVPNVNIVDGGNYTCHIANAVGMESSLNVSVLVYELPQFFLVLKPLATYAGNESGAWFSCNASAWPYPGWRWYFRAVESDPWTQFEGEDTNELTILSPQEENEGWYTCEAFNHFGYLRAPPVRLTVLPVSVSQLGTEINLIARDLTSYSSRERQIIVFLFIREEIRHLSGTIHNLNISVTLRRLSNTALRMNITIISENVTTEDTRKMSLREIENKALPARSDVILAKQGIQQAILDGRIDEIVYIRIQPETVIFNTPEYLCPPGYELHSNFLLCGEYNSIATYIF